MLVNGTLSHNDDVQTRTTGPCLVKHKAGNGQWIKPMEGKRNIETGRGILLFKSKIKKCQYLAQPATQVLLPVVIRWTFRNEHPVGTAGERGDKGEVSETRTRGITLGAALHR